MNSVSEPRVKLGIDVLCDESLDLIRSARVGLVAGPASVDKQFNNVIDRLHNANGVQLTALFGPEHGVRGHAQAGEAVTDETDEDTGLPMYSLYGDQRKPTADMVRSVDVFVVDLFDVGCRYWTFLYTMAYILQAAAEFDKKVIVLDRPNPLGGTVLEGNILHSDYSSFVGLYPIPMRTGMTIGELANYFNEQFAIHASLHVVPCRGWHRTMLQHETALPFVPPSPNTPTFDTLMLYPGTCLIEGTTLSEGRGTTRPFEFVGAPWLNARRMADALNERQLPGVHFRPVHFVPTFSKHQGEQCHGVQVHITDYDAMRSVPVGVHLLHVAKQLAPSHVSLWRPPYREGGRHFIDLLAGGDDLRTALDAGDDPDTIMQRWAADLDAFAKRREPHLLYN